MRKRTFGDGTLQLTELGLGTWGLSGDACGPVPEAEQQRVVERALVLGIRLFETADTYGQGEMERRLGRWLPEDAVVVTKIGTRLDEAPARKDFSAAYLEQAFERSRERLGREHVDCVLLHNPSQQALEQGEAVHFMEGLCERGAVRTWGVSSGTPKVTRAAMAARVPIISLSYNLYHRGELDAYMYDLLEQKTGVFVHSVLSHGLLTGTWAGNKEFPPGDHRAERWTRDALKRRMRQLSALKPVLGDSATTFRALALRFALSNHAVTSALLGARNAIQLDQLVRDSGREPPYLDPVQLTRLRECLNAAGVW